MNRNLREPRKSRLSSPTVEQEPTEETEDPLFPLLAPVRACKPPQADCNSYRLTPPHHPRIIFFVSRLLLEEPNLGCGRRPRCEKPRGCRRAQFFDATLCQCTSYCYFQQKTSADGLFEA